MVVVTSLTLKQLATRVVVREDLPIKDLPNTLKRELVAGQLHHHWESKEVWRR